MTEYRYRILQGDQIVAQGFGAHKASIEIEGHHTCAVYAQDGMTEFEFAERTPAGRWRTYYSGFAKLEEEV
jgi:hypothetical protein